MLWSQTRSPGREYTHGLRTCFFFHLSPINCLRSVAEKELKESLLFEIELAHASQARENRRNATRLYNPMMIRSDKVEVGDITQYVYLQRAVKLHHYCALVVLYQQHPDRGAHPGTDLYLIILLSNTFRLKTQRLLFWTSPVTSRTSLSCSPRLRRKPSPTTCSGEQPVPAWVTSMRRPGRYSWSSARTSPARRLR